MNQQIALLSFMRFSEAQLEKLQAISPRLEVHQHTSAAFEDVPEALRSRVEILYGWSEHFGEAHLFPRLRWIQAHSAGINRTLELPIWQKRDVIITTANGIHAVPMAEYALAMILAFRWRLRQMLQFQAQSKWPKGRWDLFSRPELRGSTLGIVGYGAIGRELGRQGQALGMRVLAVNRSGQRRPFQGFQIPGVGDPEARIPAEIYPVERLHNMLPRCDYVVLLAPLTPETRHLFDAEVFASMQPNAFFLNLSRGGLVDEAALIEALRQDHIAGAGLDVFEEEPLPADSPLWQNENVIISPHVSGFSPKYDDRASDLFAENLRRYLAGEPLLNLVDRERGY